MAGPKLNEDRRLPRRLLQPLGMALGLSAVVAQGAEMAPPGTSLPHDPAWLKVWLHWITRAVEVAGIAIIVFGAIAASLYFAWRLVRAGASTELYEVYRANLGRAILLGLEFLVAADIIGTVAVTPSLQNLAVLGLIVLIRTFLSISLEVEIEGRSPKRLEAEPGRESGSSRRSRYGPSGRRRARRAPPPWAPASP